MTDSGGYRSQASPPGVRSVPTGSHEVSVMCSCPDIENCKLELYIADVRILEAELNALEAQAA